MKQFVRIFVGLLCMMATGMSAIDTVFPALRDEDDGNDVVTIASVTDIYAMTPLIRGFMAANPDVSVIYREMTSNILTEALAEACAANVFYADLAISSAMSSHFALANQGCAQEVSTQVTDGVPASANWRNEIIGLTLEPGVIVYNKAAFPDGPPQDRFALIDMIRDRQSFIGRIGTYDVTRSGVGYLFYFYESEYSSASLRLQELLGQNRAQVFCCSTQMIDAVADRAIDLAYNVIGSYAAFRADLDPRIGVVYPSDFTLLLSRLAYIPDTAVRADLANQFLDYALSVEGRALMRQRGAFFSVTDGIKTMVDDYQFPENRFQRIPIDVTLLAADDVLTRRNFIKNWQNTFSYEGAGIEQVPEQSR